MSRADDIEFRLGAQTRGFENGMDRAKRAALGLKAGLVGLGAGISLDRIRQTIAETAKISDVADRVGLGTEALQEIRYAAQQAGVGIEVADKAMEVFSRKVAEAGAGMVNDFTRTLQANGVALRDSEGNLRSQSALLSDYADLVGRAANEQDKLRLAGLGFGEEGARMVNALRNGSAGLRDMSEEARRLGLVLEDDLVRSAKKLDDDYTRIVERMSTMWRGFVVTVVNGSIEMGKAFNEWLNPTAFTQDAQAILRTVTEIRDLETEMEAALVAAESGISRPLGRAADEIAADIDRARNQLSRLQREFVGSMGNFKFAPSRPVLPETVIPTAPGGQASRSTAISDAQRQAEAVRDVIAALEAELAALSMTTEQARIMETVRRLNIDAASAEGQAIAELITMIEAENRTAGAREDALKRQNDLIREQAAALEEVGNMMARTAEDIVSGSASAEEALKQLAKQLLIALLRAALLGQGPMASFFSPASAGGTGAPLNILPPNYSTLSPSSTAAAALASGTSMASASRTMTASSPVSITYAPSIDARGADAAAVARIESAQAKDRAEFEGRVKGVVSRHVSSGRRFG